jgi:hypothetical protein
MASGPARADRERVPSWSQCYCVAENKACAGDSGDRQDSQIFTPLKYGEYEWPKLSELREFCTGKPHQGPHDAMGDAEAVVRGLHQSKKRGDIKLSVTRHLNL